MNADALHRVLCLLADHGVFQRDGDGFSHTPASQLLRTEHPMSMRAFPQMMGQPVFSDIFGQLEYSVRTGSPAIKTIEPTGLVGLLPEPAGGGQDVRAGHDREGGG